MYMDDCAEGIMAATATERIVVQATPKEKQAISAKAKRFGMSAGELMRRAAAAYTSPDADAELAALADAALAAANRMSASIDEVDTFIAASNQRIAAMEAAAKRQKGA
jgi:hypothetical protein